MFSLWGVTPPPIQTGPTCSGWHRSPPWRPSLSGGVAHATPTPSPPAMGHMATGSWISEI